MVHQKITYIGELRCDAVHGPSGVHLITDAPIDNMGRGAKAVLRFEMPSGIPIGFRQKLNTISAKCPVKQSLHPDILAVIEFLFPD
jgi:hypothetical protein